MGIKWLDKSHRSPVSCKEISRKQVANRSQSQCKQGLLTEHCNKFCFHAFSVNLILTNVLSKNLIQQQILVPICREKLYIFIQFGFMSKVHVIKNKN